MGVDTHMGSSRSGTSMGGVGRLKIADAGNGLN